MRSWLGRHWLAAAATAAALLSPSEAFGQARALPDTLSLDAAINIALDRSPDLAAARAVASAAGVSRLAAWGRFLPRASVSAGLGRSDFTRTTFEGQEGESQILPEPLNSGAQSANQGFQLSWTLFDPANIANLSQQSANLRSTQRQIDDRMAGVVAEAGRRFYEALRNQRLLDVTSRQIGDRELELELARRRYEIAAVERIDVLAAERQLLDAQVTLLRSRDLAQTALRSLAVALGLPPDEGLGTVLAEVGALPVFDVSTGEMLVEAAITIDPEILRLEADHAAASAGLWASRSPYIPTIQANLSWSRSQNFALGEPFFQFDPNDTGRNFSLSASWTLFDGFQREQQTAQASSQRRQAEENLRGRRLQIEGEVRGFVNRIDQLSQTLSLAEQSLLIAQERLTMTRQMYQNGTIAEFTQLQQAVDGVISAEQQLINIRFDYLVAWVSLAEYGGARSS